MELQKTFRHCEIDDVGLTVSGDGAQSLIAAINRYLHVFAYADGKCPRCEASLGGFLSSFTFGLRHGEGACRCGWPCRAVHHPRGDDGKEITSFHCVLPYHPEFVTAS